MVVFVTKMTHFMSVKKKKKSIIYVFNEYISGYVNWNYLIIYHLIYSILKAPVCALLHIVSPWLDSLKEGKQFCNRCLIATIPSSAK